MLLYSIHIHYFTEVLPRLLCRGMFKVAVALVFTAVLQIFTRGGRNVEARGKDEVLPQPDGSILSGGTVPSSSPPPSSIIPNLLSVEQKQSPTFSLRVGHRISPTSPHISPTTRAEICCKVPIKSPYSPTSAWGPPLGKLMTSALPR